MGELFVSMWEEVQRGTVRMKPHEDRNTGRAGVVSWTSRCSVRRIEMRSIIEGARVPCSSVDQVKCASVRAHCDQWDGAGMTPEISE